MMPVIRILFKYIRQYLQNFHEQEVGKIENLLGLK